MYTLHFKNGKTMQWLDMSSQLHDKEMENATLDNPIKVTFSELPPPLVEQFPYNDYVNSESDHTYLALRDTADKIEFVYDEYEYPIGTLRSEKYTLNFPASEVSLVINTGNPQFYTDWEFDTSWSDYNQGWAWRFCQGMCLSVKNAEDNEYYINQRGYALFSKFGGWASDNKYIYEDNRIDTIQGYLGTSYPVGWYTYLAKYDTKRIDVHGNVILDFGLCVISSPEKLVTNKEYNCLSNDSMKRNADGGPYKDGWISINYINFSRYVPEEPTSDRKIERYVNATQAATVIGTGIVDPDTIDDRYSSEGMALDDILYVICVEGAIMKSSAEPERRLLTLSNINKTGLYTLYCTNRYDDVVDFNNNLWSTAVEAAKENYNILSSVLSFGYLPINITTGVTTDDEGDIIASGTFREVYVGGRTINNVLMSKLNKQYLKFRSEPLYYPGIYIDKPWHYLDFAPYSNAFVTLPYIGTESISPSDFMSRLMLFEYTIDCFTGLCTCKLWRTKRTDTDSGFNTNPPNFSTDYDLVSEYTGSCLINLPLSSNNWQERNLQELSLSQQGRRATIATVGSAVKMAAGAAVGAAVGGGAAGAAVGGLLASGDFINDLNTIKEINENKSMMSYPSVSISYGGSNQATAGIISNQDIRLTIKYPNVDEEIGNAWAKYNGYQTLKDCKISDFENGTYLRARNVKKRIPSTEQNNDEMPGSEEYSEIIALLKGGVFI